MISKNSLPLLLVCILFYCCKNDDDPIPEKLVAEIMVSDSILDAGQQVLFTDASTGTPTSWEWSFEGGTPSNSTDPSPNVTYSSAGVFNVTLKVSNDFEPNGTMTTTKIVVLPIDGLIAFYPFENTADDQSGNGFDGTLENGVSSFMDRNNQNNQAYSFDGVDDHIVTSSEIDENLNSGASFSSWIYLTSVGTFDRILSNYNGTGLQGNCNGRIGFVFGVTPEQQLNIFYSVDGDDLDGRMTASASLEMNQWYHVVGTWDGTYAPSGFTLYIDGVRGDVLDQEEGNVACGGFVESVNPFHIGIGHCSMGFCHPFDGGIDEVRIYDRPLTDNEILALSKS